MLMSLTARPRGIVRLVAIALMGLMAAAASPAMAEEGANDAQFSSLFATWKKMNNGGAAEETAATSRTSIPSREPVETLDFSSNFGTRSDPFNGNKRMHQGVDIRGALGTPVYATADGVVARAEWSGGYGNLVEINHGNGMETRYGHLSRLIAQPNEFVRRGQLIGLMGSTGRSTGSHLHYEVRIAGNAVNPLPYLQGTNYEIALADARNHEAMDEGEEIAMGGPEARKSSDNARK